MEVSIPKLDAEPAKVAEPKVPVPDAGVVEPGKIPPLAIPMVPPKKDDVLLFPDRKYADPPAGGLQIPPIDLPIPGPAPPTEKKSTSGSSPLVNESAGPKVSVKPVPGAAPAAGRYSVRFFNFTDSAFKLTVEDGSISLPAKHFVDVQIGKAFTWKAGAGRERKVEIPADVKALEIAVRP
jgi:hypothetical protein